jgi:hypothetical protein
MAGQKPIYGQCDLGEALLADLLEAFRQKGSSNLREQKALLCPVLRLLKGYYVIILGDREFRSVRLAHWLDAQGVYFALRQKKSALHNGGMNWG